MILSPLRQDLRITQGFGENPSIYKQFGLAGHNGQDIATPIGTELFAPIDGLIEFKDTGKQGYGKHVVITENKKGIRRQVVLGHLSEFIPKYLQTKEIQAGQLIGLSGNSGFSTGAHLHWGLRRLDENGNIINYGKGYFGYENIFEQGWITKNEPSKY